MNTTEKIVIGIITGLTVLQGVLAVLSIMKM
jgi:hypothetical protein